MSQDTRRGAWHFARMRVKIETLYPELTKEQITYACNKIGNFIRSNHVDMYDITLSKVPIYGQRIDEITFEVEVGNVIVYFWAATD